MPVITLIILHWHGPSTHLGGLAQLEREGPQGLVQSLAEGGHSTRVGWSWAQHSRVWGRRIVKFQTMWAAVNLGLKNKNKNTHQETIWLRLASEGMCRTQCQHGLTFLSYFSFKLAHRGFRDHSFWHFSCNCFCWFPLMNFLIKLLDIYPLSHR